MSPKEGKSIKVGCGSPVTHAEHLCMMMEKGQTAAVRRVAGNAFVCANCGARAAVKEVLCKPRAVKHA
jgi:hypothetical protein